MHQIWWRCIILFKSHSCLSKSDHAQFEHFGRPLCQCVRILKNNWDSSLENLSALFCFLLSKKTKTVLKKIIIFNMVGYFFHDRNEVVDVYGLFVLSQGFQWYKALKFMTKCTFSYFEHVCELGLSFWINDWGHMFSTADRDIQQVFDDWLSTSNQNRASDSTSPSQPMEEKQITMPTDFAEPLVCSCRFIFTILMFAVLTHANQCCPLSQAK